MTRVHKGRHDMWWFHTQINNCELHVSLPLFEGFGLDTSHVRSVPKKVCIYIYTVYNFVIFWCFLPTFLGTSHLRKVSMEAKKLFLRSSSFFHQHPTYWHSLEKHVFWRENRRSWGFVLGTALFKINPSHGQPSSSEDLIGTTLGLCQWTWLSWVDQLNPWSMFF